MSQAIRYWDRQSRTLETEKVYGDGAVRWLYGTRFGEMVADKLLARRWFSELTGWYQSSPWSKHRIASFIKEFSIDMEEYENVSYESFNDFFARRFRPGARVFCEPEHELGAFAEARYLAFEHVEREQTFPVKGEHLSATGLLGSEERAQPFEGGPVLIARLCPTDYHRYHFPASGRMLSEVHLPGALHSVNPLALQARSDIFVTNDRRASLLRCEPFGLLAFIEVGALNVGRIVATHSAEDPFRRGDEKGYFLFGGSTVILLGEPGRWRPDADLLEKSQLKIESFVRLGERVAQAL